MQIGKLKKENEQILKLSKQLGFKSKTAMIDLSLSFLRRRLKRKKRELDLAQALNDYSKSTVINHFDSIDGDDFEGR